MFPRFAPPEVIFSASGTPIVQRRVSELVTENPARTSILDEHGIDYSYRWRTTLEEACRAVHLSTSDLVDALESASITSTVMAEFQPNPARLSLDEMVDHIVHTHHDYLRRELPSLWMLSVELGNLDCGTAISLRDVRDAVQMLTAETDCHISKEEESLFPAIRDLVRGRKSDPAKLADLVRHMMVEHDDTGDDLAELRKLTQSYTLLPDYPDTLRSLLTGLHEVDKDMRIHIHLENAVLFPSSLALAQQS